jgi:hypothetical protein
LQLRSTQEIIRASVRMSRSRAASWIVGLAVGATLLPGCSEPPPTGDGTAARDGAALAAPAAPKEVMVMYQPTQLCPSPAACLQGDELAWVPAGTKLGVVELQVQELPPSNVYWFHVGYEGRDGWVSEFATDQAPRVRGGKIVRE